MKQDIRQLAEQVLKMACEQREWFGLRVCHHNASACCARCGLFVCPEHSATDAQGKVVCRACYRLFAPEALLSVAPVAVTLEEVLTSEVCVRCRVRLCRCPHCSLLYCFRCGFPTEAACRGAFAEKALEEIVAYQLTRRFEEK